ncbi:MAG TPA: WecB/TagA/CpsF family glycosyltransferase [Myxococcales bacterium]|nr:WecB/TagA/CpsF family glycosyltransferase [Myxococcales bacterium]
MRVRIGSVWIDALTEETALEAIDALRARGGGMVFTPNVDHIVKVEGNPQLRAAYDAADLAIADGQWVVWASRLLGTPLPVRVAGSDLALPLARRAAERGRSLYLLGGAPGAAEEAAARLRRETSVRVCGYDAPRIDLDSPDDEVAERIARAKPDFVVVALGCPKQERWSLRYRDRLRPAVLLGMGATVDFLAGRVRRSPPWVSRLGMEWLFRLALEPRRLARRYLVDDPRFLALLMRTRRLPRSSRIRATATL